MGVEDKGWIGGGSSAADAVWNGMWDEEGGSTGAPPGRVTEGPLADFHEGYDPIAAQRSLRAEHQQALSEKTARIVGSDNEFDSPHEPGGNRVVQKDTSAGKESIVQNPESARGPQGDSGTKKDSSPSKGSRGAEVMRRLKAKKSSEDNPEKAETGTQSVGGDAQGKRHNLNVKDNAPTPKELDPGRRVGNLADYHNKSSFTGSGPQAALHDDYSKVGELEVDPDLVGSLLLLAGVPPRPLPDNSLLMKQAVHVAAMEMTKEASDSGYLERNDVHPLKLVAELGDTLGDEWTSWEPETIRETIIKEAGIDPSDDVMSKIMAVKIVLAAPQRFFDDWHAFEKISMALNDVSPNMGMVEDVPAEWLSNAVAIVEKIATEADFGPEVQKYVAARLFDQGYVVAPPKLAFANPALVTMGGDDAMRKQVLLAYKEALASPDDPERMRETPVNIQVARLMRNHTYVLSKIDESREQMS